MKRVCLDANVWIKVLTEEPDSPQAQDLVIRLFRERAEVVAPAIMKVEVGSILRKKWSRRLFSQEHLVELWRKFLVLPITYHDHMGMYDAAWSIAEANRLIHLYDAVYLALGEDIEFWTADVRLAHSVTQTNVKFRLLSSFGS